MAREPCGNEDCDACNPLPRWDVTTVTVRRIAHEREIKAATPEAALAIYNEGTGWPSSYDERTLETLEEHEPSVTLVTDEHKLKYYKTGLCWHNLEKEREAFARAVEVDDGEAAGLDEGARGAPDAGDDNDA